MKKIIIVQRYKKIGKYNEVRDSLSTDLSRFIIKLGYLPIPYPSEVLPENFIKFVKPKAIIFSGGDDPKKKDLRRDIEIKFLKLSIKRNITVIGICRGAQQINLFCKGKISKISSHVRKKHKIKTNFSKKLHKINCYHDYGILRKNLGKNLNILATARDGSIECFKHNKRNWLGVMWHPERNANLSKIDKKIFNSFLQNKI